MTLHTAAGARKYLNVAERQRFAAAAKTMLPEHRLFCLLLMWSGCRISEALAVTPMAINREAGTIAFLSGDIISLWGSGGLRRRVRDWRILYKLDEAHPCGSRSLPRSVVPPVGGSLRRAPIRDLLFAFSFLSPLQLSRARSRGRQGDPLRGWPAGAASQFKDEITPSTPKYAFPVPSGRPGRAGRRRRRRCRSIGCRACPPASPARSSRPLSGAMDRRH